MAEREFHIRECPSCGSENIKKKRGTWRGEHDGKAYSVPGLQFYSCPDCDEKVYPPEAVRRIQECSPAYKRKGSRRSA